MPRKKEEWILGSEAAALLTEKSGHEVKQNYVRLLAVQGKIRQRKRDGRTNEYLKSDIEEYHVRQNRKGEDVKNKEVA